MEMITVKEATSVIMSHQQELGVISIPFESAMGHILAEAIYADRDFPPFNRVSMDGIAIHYDTWSLTKNKQAIESVAPAGQPQVVLKDLNNCVEVMTGAILPENCDTVVRYEDLLIEEGNAKIAISEVLKGKNVHTQGIDGKKGDLLIEKGTIISPAEIGILATTGKSSVEVYKNHRIAVISTGDELVSVDQHPLPHQIRMSNSFQIASLLKSKGFDVYVQHLNDEPSQMKESIQKLMKTYDVLILSGGVSKGKFDYVPEVLQELGVQKHFHKVKQRPGKPFWFGTAPNCTVFALPGNPISSFVCTIRYVLPWLNKNRKSSQSPLLYARLADDVDFKPDLTFFLEVSLEFSPEGLILAHPQRGNGSGDLANAPKVDAYLELPQGKNLYKKGEVYRLYPFRSFY
jgi:molybdopterin molybdotransferase